MDHRDNELLSSYLQDFIQRHDELNIDMAYVVRRIRSLEYDHNNMGLQITALSKTKESLQTQIVELRQEIAHTRKCLNLPRKQYDRAVVAEQLQFLRDAITRAPGARMVDLRRAFEERWPKGVMSDHDFCYQRVYHLIKNDEIFGEARTGYVINNLRNREMGIKTFDG